MAVPDGQRKDNMVPDASGRRSPKAGNGARQAMNQAYRRATPSARAAAATAAATAGATRSSNWLGMM